MRTVWLALIAACTTTAQRPMTLRRVILYQNGIGYFERSGHVTGQAMHLSLRFARGELDDVLKTLTVVDRLGAGVATVDVPAETGGNTVDLGVRLAVGRVHDVTVGYATPTPTWKATYRVVLGDRSEDRGLLQAWAMVNNASQDDWRGVQLTLATGAPMSYALDLHTPEYVRRPDANGRLVAPTTGPVAPETHGAADRDGDGIPDALDKCPDEPETYNGVDDEDGCPDRGRVIVTTSEVVILQAIRFAAGSDVVASDASPIVDAIATTLAANPEIEQIELGGNTSGEEADPWGLATRRANAVRDALVARGIAAHRLRVVPYGATQPLGNTPDVDRRVDFLIVRRADARPATGPLTPAAVATSAHAATRPADIAGAVRYVLSEPVSIRRGGTSMVAILDKPVDATDVYLWRPEAAAPGSDRHPYRAVELANTSGYTLEPGPIAIFARGAFVGDSLLSRLAIGETAWIPYALDGATTVTVEPAADERPLRIVAVHHGIVTVETTATRTTRYTVAAGREPARTIYLRHGKAAGFAARDLPPGTLDQGDAYLVPLPLQPGKTSVLVVNERQPRRKTLELADAYGGGEIGAYVDGSQLGAGVREALAQAIALRTDAAALDTTVAALRARIGELASRAEEIRRSLRALEHVGGADDLRKKLVADLGASTAESDSLARQLADKGEQLATARARLEDTIRDLVVAE